MSNSRDIVNQKEITLLYSKELTMELLKDNSYNDLEFDKVEYLDDNIVKVYYKTIVPEYVMPPKTGVNYTEFMVLIEAILVSLYLTKKKLG